MLEWIVSIKTKLFGKWSIPFTPASCFAVAYCEFTEFIFILNSHYRAKLRYCPYWPLAILYCWKATTSFRRQNSQNTIMCLFFWITQFGSKPFWTYPEIFWHDWKNLSLVVSFLWKIYSLQPYLEHKSKYIKKNRSALFQKAVKECDCYMADNENVIIEFAFFV